MLGPGRVPKLQSSLGSLVCTSSHIPPSFPLPLFVEKRGCILLLQQEVIHRASKHWLPFPRALNILKIFVILLTTGGYNSLLAESKSTSCQRIPEPICMIPKSKNKMKWFYSHPALPQTQIHTLTAKSWASVIRQNKPHHLLLAPASPSLSLRRDGSTPIWDIQTLQMQIVPADCKVKSELLSAMRDLRDRGDPSQGKGCRLSLLCS